VLPEMTQTGDLPAGIYGANWTEIEDRFGHGTEARVRAFQKLRHLYGLAHRTGNLSRFLVFGSFVSAVANPRDVDIVLIMNATFVLENAPRECRTLFSHADAEARYGASVFWIRAGMLAENDLQLFLDTWQTKRDGTLRGIVEVRQ
jgi:hypothetical protein